LDTFYHLNNQIFFHTLQDPFLFTIVFNSENKQEWDF
jgi:hypothetical protein